MMLKTAPSPTTTTAPTTTPAPTVAVRQVVEEHPFSMPSWAWRGLSRRDRVLLTNEAGRGD